MPRKCIEQMCRVIEEINLAVGARFYRCRWNANVEKCGCAYVENIGKVFR